MNKVILKGNLTRDVELTFTTNQLPIAKVDLAVNRKWKSKDGQSKDEVLFITCKAFGKQAETLSKYVKKGDPLLIGGRLCFEQWEKEGRKFSRHTVTITDFELLSRQEPQKSQEPQESEIPF